MHQRHATRTGEALTPLASRAVAPAGPRACGPGATVIPRQAATPRGPAAEQAASPLPGLREWALELQAVPAPPPGQQDGQVIQVTLGPREWLLFALPGDHAAGGEDLPGLAAGIAADYRPARAAGTGLLARVPSLAPMAGAAVLHSAAGQAAIYVRSTQLTRTGAGWLSALAASSRVRASRAVTITRAPHDELRRQRLHPAAAPLITADAARIVACEDTVTAEAADAIGRLCTARAALAVPGA